jgi:putative transposase
MTILRTQAPSFLGRVQVSHRKLQSLTYKFRLRDKHAVELNRQARAVNAVWNYCNEAQWHMLRWDRWLSAYDLMKLTASVGKEFDIHAHTVQRVCRAYADARRAQCKPWLRWRGRKSLGWVPFNTGHVAFDGECFAFRGVRYKTMHLRDLLPRAKIGAGSFNRDARVRWYLNCPMEVECADRAPLARPGIDLGLKHLATLSTGAKIEVPRFYRGSKPCSPRHSAPARPGAQRRSTPKSRTGAGIICTRRATVSPRNTD